MPRISVIMPAHNAAAYLPEALRSIESQTFADWEVVAVDDGSTDDTWALLQAAGPRVRALRNSTPSGPATARNEALTVAEGECAVFLDADDLLLPTYMERQLECLDAANRRGITVGLVTCDALLIEGEQRASHTYLGTIRGADRPLTLDRVLKRNPIYISSLVPMDVGRQVGWFDPLLFGTEDFGLWLKILERGYTALLNPEPLAVHRRQAGSVSSNIARQGANNRRTYELALERGLLNPRQQRIAKRAIRYNRAMEAVAAAWFGASGPSRRRLLPLLPLLGWVVLTNPQWWRQWIAVLRTQRQPPVAQRQTAPARRR